AHFLVGRVPCLAAGVADRGRVHAGGLPEQPLGAPEAAHAEHGALQAPGKRRLQRMPIHEMLRRDLQRRRAARKRALRRQQLGRLLPEREHLHDSSKTWSVPVLPRIAPCVFASTVPAPSVVWWRRGSRVPARTSRSSRAALNSKPSSTMACACAAKVRSNPSGSSPTPTRRSSERRTAY